MKCDGTSTRVLILTIKYQNITDTMSTNNPGDPESSKATLSSRVASYRASLLYPSSSTDPKGESSKSTKLPTNVKEIEKLVGFINEQVRWIPQVSPIVMVLYGCLMTILLFSLLCAMCVCVHITVRMCSQQLCRNTLCGSIGGSLVGTDFLF